MLNLASLLMGLSAWVLGLASMAKKGCCSLSIGSFTLCGGALVLQFFEINRRVTLSDWSALMDTMPGLAKVASVLLIVTVVLNVAALWKGRRER